MSPVSIARWRDQILRRATVGALANDLDAREAGLPVDSPTASPSRSPWCCRPLATEHPHLIRT